MATLIDKTYFHTELFISNITESSEVEQARAAELQRFIDKYEPIYMNNVLGETLYSEFLAGLALNPIPAKWTALKALFVDTSKLLSPIASYVYFYYMRNHATETTAAGEVTSVTENGEVVGANYKMVRAYNEASESADLIKEWLRSNIATYPTFVNGGSFGIVNTFGI